MMYSVSLNKLRKLDKWRTKEEVTDLKHYLLQVNSIRKGCPYEIGKIPKKTQVPERFTWRFS